jgi:hypothetical protein
MTSSVELMRIKIFLFKSNSAIKNENNMEIFEFNYGWVSMIDDLSKFQTKTDHTIWRETKFHS